MALTTHSRVKEYLGIKADDASKDAMLAEFVERVSAAISTRCKRVFEFESGITEYDDGDGVMSQLMVRRYPIVSVASLYDDPDRAYGSATLIAATEYTVDKGWGLIQLDGFRFLKGLQSVKVVYDGGYKVIPQDLERAAIILCAADFLDSQSELKVSVDVETVERISRQREDADRLVDLYMRPVL